MTYKPSARESVLLYYRNPGHELRGVITVLESGDPLVVVTTSPAVTVDRDEIETDIFVAVCECFSIAGGGSTSVQAIDDLTWTLQCYLEELLRTGRLFSELERLGWMKVEGANVPTLIGELREKVLQSSEGLVPQVSATMRSRQAPEAA